MFNIYRTRVTVEESAPAAVTADALAIPANDHLWMGSGLLGEIKNVGGEEIEIEAVQQGPVELGRAVATGAGSLSFKRIYHLVIMGQDLHIRVDQVRAALEAALAQASRDNIETLAISPMTSEEQLAPLRDASHEEAAALIEGLSKKTTLRKVILAASKSETVAIYRDALHGALRSHLGGA